jgi:hypothetical protein
MKKCNLTASDFNIVVNLIETHSSLRDGERFVPICLPNFNQKFVLFVDIFLLTVFIPF